MSGGPPVQQVLLCHNFLFQPETPRSCHFKRPAGLRISVRTIWRTRPIVSSLFSCKGRVISQGLWKLLTNVLEEAGHLLGFLSSLVSCEAHQNQVYKFSLPLLKSGTAGERVGQQRRLLLSLSDGEQAGPSGALCAHLDYLK